MVELVRCVRCYVSPPAVEVGDAARDGCHGEDTHRQSEHGDVEHLTRYTATEGTFFISTSDRCGKEKGIVC